MLSLKIVAAKPEIISAENFETCLGLNVKKFLGALEETKRNNPKVPIHIDIRNSPLQVVTALAILEQQNKLSGFGLNYIVEAGGPHDFTIRQCYKWLKDYLVVIPRGKSA